MPLLDAPQLAHARLLEFYGTSTAPDAGNVVRLAQFESKNDAVARPDLVTGPVFKFASPS